MLLKTTRRRSALRQQLGGQQLVFPHCRERTSPAATAATAFHCCHCLLILPHPDVPHDRRRTTACRPTLPMRPQAIKAVTCKLPFSTNHPPVSPPLPPLPLPLPAAGDQRRDPQAAFLCEPDRGDRGAAPRGVKAQAPCAGPAVGGGGGGGGFGESAGAAWEETAEPLREEARLQHRVLDLRWVGEGACVAQSRSWIVVWGAELCASSTACCTFGEWDAGLQGCDGHRDGVGRET